MNYLMKKTMRRRQKSDALFGGIIGVLIGVGWLSVLGDGYGFWAVPILAALFVWFNG